MVDKFSLLASTASDWWWETDAQLRITFLSERFAELFGVPVSSIVGKLRVELAAPTTTLLNGAPTSTTSRTIAPTAIS